MSSIVQPGIQHRNLPASNYTIVSNAWLRDTRLSIEARGLLALLASHTAGFVMSLAALRTASGCGRERLERILSELESHDYLTKTRCRKPDGTVGANAYEIHDPAGKPMSAEPASAESASAEQAYIRRLDLEDQRTEDQEQPLSPSVVPTSTGELVTFTAKDAVQVFIDCYREHHTQHDPDPALLGHVSSEAKRALKAGSPEPEVRGVAWAMGWPASPRTWGQARTRLLEREHPEKWGQRTATTRASRGDDVLRREMERALTAENGRMLA